VTALMVLKLPKMHQREKERKIATFYLKRWLSLNITHDFTICNLSLSYATAKNDEISVK
jgi:hypothetical protein